MKNQIAFLALCSLLLFSCSQSKNQNETGDSSAVNDTVPVSLDSAAVAPGSLDSTVVENSSSENAKTDLDISKYNFPVVSAASLKVNPNLTAMVDAYVNKLEHDSIDPGVLNLPEKYRACYKDRPKSIKDLTDGIALQAYQFKRGDEGKLSILGFVNLDIDKKETITVLEFSQTGTQNCNNVYLLKYGIGARMMLRVRSTKSGARLNTPQQISASAILGKAEVSYSLRTFGIVGPGISNLNKVDTMNEDTYTGFLQAVSELIINAYAEKPNYIITPQPMFLVDK